LETESGQVNLTQLIRDVQNKEVVEIPAGLSKEGFDIISAIIKHGINKVKITIIWELFLSKKSKNQIFIILA